MDPLPVELRRLAVVALAGRGEAVDGVGRGSRWCSVTPAALSASSITSKSCHRGRRVVGAPREVDLGLHGVEPEVRRVVAVADEPGAVDRRRRADAIGHRLGEGDGEAAAHAEPDRADLAVARPPRRRRRSRAAPRRRPGSRSGSPSPSAPAGRACPRRSPRTPGTGRRGSTGTAASRSTRRCASRDAMSCSAGRMLGASIRYRTTGNGPPCSGCLRKVVIDAVRRGDVDLPLDHGVTVRR